MRTRFPKLCLVTALVGVALLGLLTCAPSPAQEAAPDLMAQDIQGYASTLIVQQESLPAALVLSGARLTYTLAITYSDGDLHATITNTLSPHVYTDESMAGVGVLPGGLLVWTPTLGSAGWVWQVPVTVAAGYEGLLTNTLEMTSREGPRALSTHTVRAATHFETVYLPMVARQRALSALNLLSNPGFEGIGLPVDNALPNPDNWTRDTFNGQVYGEIFSPEGWVTWWEEGDYGRPECKVIPNEPPFTFEPHRIYQGYYAGMCFGFYRKMHAGYYQVVSNLEPGATVEGWFYAHAWSCGEDPPYSCGDPYAFHFQAGIDPNGGADPFSTAILWSEPTYIYDVYTSTHTVQATVGPAGQVTFYLRAHAKWAVKHNDAYWDNPTLVYTQP